MTPKSPKITGDSILEALSAARAPLTPADLAAGNLAITGCILSNELIDALPTHLVEMTADGLREVYVTVRDGELAEALDVPSTPDLQAYLDRICISVAGPRVEADLDMSPERWGWVVGGFIYLTAPTSNNSLAAQFLAVGYG